NEPTCWGVAVEALKVKSKRNLPRPFIDAITLELNPDEFSAATLDQYLQEILELLASHDACELRAVWLEDLGSRELGQRILVVSGPPSALNYLRELCWVAYGELWFAFERFGEAALEALNSMICDPEALRLAHRAYLDGPEVLTDWIDRHQLAISRWLGQEIKTGRLRRSFGPQIAGKHVAAWRRVPPVAPGADDTQNETLSSYRMEFEFNDDLNEARRILAERWMIPDCLIVDACVN
ncbi:MAG: hypothetical protein NT069_05380, partial [Planctomycetota bacterium]|nr:hypothetical protein [Planctomycetota bacterium]